MTGSLTNTWGQAGCTKAIEVMEFLKMLTSFKNESRPTIQAILDHHWLASTLFDHEDGLDPLVKYLDDTNAVTFK